MTESVIKATLLKLLDKCVERAHEDHTRARIEKAKAVAAYEEYKRASNEDYGGGGGFGTSSYETEAQRTIEIEHQQFANYTDWHEIRDWAQEHLIGKTDVEIPT